MTESKLFQYSVTVKGNLEASSAVCGTVFCHKALSEDEIKKIEQMRYDDAAAYCRDVLHGNFVISE